MSQLIKDISLHLAKQRKQSLVHKPYGLTFCAYRGDDNTMCAVGCLIPDELYVTDFEAKGVGMLLHRNPAIQKHFQDTYNPHGRHAVSEVYDALHHAQKYHDGGEYTKTINQNQKMSDEDLAVIIEKDIRRRLE